MHALSLPANILTSAASNALSGLASRVSTAAGSFASNLEQAQSADSPVSSSLAQLRSDLQSGNLAAAQSDLASLRQTLALRKTSTNSAAQSSSEGATQGSANSVLSALQNYNVLEQSAYNSALNLSMPASLPSISLNA